MELKENEIVYKFSNKGVRKMYVKENDGIYIKLVDIKKREPVEIEYPINHVELNFVGRTHEECVNNTLAAIKRLAAIKLY